MSKPKFDDPRKALEAGMAVGMWRIERDDILWRLPGDNGRGPAFEGVATARDCPRECCGWFFVADPEVVKANQARS